MPMSPEENAKYHRKAFRVTFDYLTAHFPPGMDAEWWQKAWDDLTEAGKQAGEGKLAIGLLVTVYEYLEHEFKLRRDLNADAEH